MSTPIEGEKNRCAGITENDYERKQRKKLHASFVIGDKIIDSYRCQGFLGKIFQDRRFRLLPNEYCKQAFRATAR
jgi:hypothetical protein